VGISHSLKIIMASNHPQYTSHNAVVLLPKLNDDDPDLRYMALSDICAILTHGPPSLFQNEYTNANKIVEAVIQSLKDINGEVQNMAVKCIEPLVHKVTEPILCNIIDKVTQLPTADAVDNAVPALALRAILSSMSHPVQGAPRSKEVETAYSAVKRVLIPRLTGPVRPNTHEPSIGMVQTDLNKGTDTNTMDVLTDVARYFGPMLSDSEFSLLITVSRNALNHQKSSIVMKKKAVIALSALFPFLSPKLSQTFMANVISDAKSNQSKKSHQKLILSLLASLAKSSPSKFSQYLASLATLPISALSQEEIDNDLEKMEETEERDPEADEVRESALLALESWLTVCSKSMQQFAHNVLEIIRRFLQYDPNFAHYEDMSDFEEEENLEGDDFEEDIAGDDEDDASWKVRRCAAKLAHALIVTQTEDELLESDMLYTTIAPELISRFAEREEVVKLEILSALSTLIKLTGGNLVPVAFGSNQINGHAESTSRKRRRAGSDATMVDLQPDTLQSKSINTALLTSKSFMALEEISPSIVKGLAEILQSGSMPAKQASIQVLRDLVYSLHGKLLHYLNSTLPTIIEAISTSKLRVNTGTTSTSIQSYRVEALYCLGAILQVQSHKELQPYLPNLVSAVVLTIHDRSNKISLASLHTAEHLIHSLTPPRSSTKENLPHLDKLTSALIAVASAHETDLEVRKLAIQHLGLLLGRSSLGHSLLSHDIRVQGMALLLQRLKNETTRLISARAIESASAYSKNASDFPKDWVDVVSKELIQQFRKASRSLRGASLTAMRTLATNPVSRVHLSKSTVDEVLVALLQLIKVVDFHTLTPSLLILAAIIEKDSKNSNLPRFVDPLCALLSTSMPSGAWRSYLTVIRTFGNHGIGKPLMDDLLSKWSLTAPPDVVGKVIGTLLVAGQDHVGVSLDNFVTELGSKSDEKRKCLALGVLGEAASIIGASSGLTPQFFIQRFTGVNDPINQAAASALGRAGSGNVSTYVPVILSSIGASTNPLESHLILIAIREIVNADDFSDLAPYVQELWNQVMTASQDQTNRTVGAECLGRLVLLEPRAFLPQIQNLLATNSSVSLRNLGLSALRVTVTSDTSIAHTEEVNLALKPAIAAVCDFVPTEQDLNNRKIGLTIINAAIHSRFHELIVSSLDPVLSLIINETNIRPELIKEVTMGPFKHKVDDGIECRKVCHQTQETNLHLIYLGCP
jgi:cullin-associated NEDD8-dissociated protein 1